MNMAGNNVRLRPIRLEDTQILCGWKNDEQLYMYLGGGYQPISVDQYRKWVENMIDQTGTNRRFLIEYADGTPVGMVGLYEISWIHRTCEIGAFLGNGSFQGKGIASEACGLLEDYAAKYLNLRKIRLKVVSDNQRARAFWQRLGYENVGVLKEERYINGRYCDVEIMEKFIQPSERPRGGDKSCKNYSLVSEMRTGWLLCA